MTTGLVLGILSIPNHKNNSFIGQQSESFREIINVARQMNCTAYVFSPFDFNSSQNSVQGYIYNIKEIPGNWEQKSFPLPTVIYNRIPNRTLENRQDIRKIIELLKKTYGRRFFNPCFLDKWETHKILLNNKHIANHLPETQELKNEINLFNMLEKHGAVYLKPTANSLGNNIMKICKTDNGKYFFVHQFLKEKHQGYAGDCSSIIKQLHSGKDDAYLIQQAIPLAKISGRPFDLRFLIQRNGQGQWERTGLATRIAGKESITTHIFYGGARCSAKFAIKEAARRHKFSENNVYKELEKFETIIPKTIEKAYNHSFGELEMDVGIDEKGKLWFFEANSKPFRFDEKLIRAESLVRLIHYACYLNSKRSL